MSHDPFDDLPDQIREALKEMMRKLQEVDPDELESMMNELLGEDFMEKLRDMSHSGGAFSFPLDPNMAKNFEVMMKNFMGTSNDPFSQSHDQETEEIQEEEPYYEISPIVDDEGQIIVEMPGISDVRQVKWEREDEIIRIEAETDEVKYFVEIPLSEKFTLKDAFASIKNSVFILPYKE